MYTWHPDSSPQGRFLENQLGFAVVTSRRNSISCIARAALGTSLRDYRDGIGGICVLSLLDPTTTKWPHSDDRDQEDRRSGSRPELAT